MSNGENIPGPEQQNSAKNYADAGTEEDRIARGRLDLNEEAKRSEHRRRERLHDALSAGGITLVRILTEMVILIIAIMGWHYFGPEKWAWMSSEQIDRAETAIAGSAAPLVILFLRRRL